ALRLDRGEADLFEIGEGGIDDTRARAVIAAGAALELLDELIAVARVLLEEMQQQKLQVAGADLAAHPETVAATAAMAPVPAKEAAAMAMSTPATAAADKAVRMPILMIFMEKTHILVFRVFHLTYRKIWSFVRKSRPTREQAMRMTRLDMLRRRLNIAAAGPDEGSWMMMFETTARVPTANGSRYLQQLCKHWSHNLKVEFSPEAAPTSVLSQ